MIEPDILAYSSSKLRADISASSVIVVVLAGVLVDQVPAQSANEYPFFIPEAHYMPTDELRDLFREAELELNGWSIKYHVFLPPGVGENEQLPLIIWLHGFGRAELELRAGNLKFMSLLITDQALPELYRFAILSVQCPREAGSWMATCPAGNESSGKTFEVIDVVMSLATELAERHPIDRSRIAVVGISAGGRAAWHMADRYGAQLAAVAPLASPVPSLKGKGVKEVPIWSFVSAYDEGLSVDTIRESVGRLRQQDVEARLTIIDRKDHNCWTPAFEDNGLLEWILWQRNGTADRWMSRYSGLALLLLATVISISVVTFLWIITRRAPSLNR